MTRVARRGPRAGGHTDTEFGGIYFVDVMASGVGVLILLAVVISQITIQKFDPARLRERLQNELNENPISGVRMHSLEDCDRVANAEAWPRMQLFEHALRDRSTGTSIAVDELAPGHEHLRRLAAALPASRAAGKHRLIVEIYDTEHLQRMNETFSELGIAPGEYCMHFMPMHRRLPDVDQRGQSDTNLDYHESLADLWTWSTRGADPLMAAWRRVMGRDAKRPADQAPAEPYEPKPAGDADERASAADAPSRAADEPARAAGEPSRSADAPHCPDRVDPKVGASPAHSVDVVSLLEGGGGEPDPGEEPDASTLPWVLVLPIDTPLARVLVVEGPRMQLPRTHHAISMVLRDEVHGRSGKRVVLPPHAEISVLDGTPWPQGREFGELQWVHVRVHAGDRGHDGWAWAALGPRVIAIDGVVNDVRIHGNGRELVKYRIGPGQPPLRFWWVGVMFVALATAAAIAFSLRRDRP